ncbi:MAG: acyl-CoA dehydrogenase family protein [Ilumatobacteraceae bacterium]
MVELIERVRAFADEVLFPAALEVDRTGVIPESHWEQMADLGLYGLAAPADAGGPGLGLFEIIDVIETMAAGCMATTFTWVQHHGVVMGLANTSEASLRDRYLADALAGRIRGGVAFAGVIPDPPRMRARRTDGGWLISGEAPFVSGWGIIDILQMSAGDEETGDIIAAIVPAVEQPGTVDVEPHQLVAAQGTQTVSLHVRDLFVTDDTIVGRTPRAQFLANQGVAVRLNGTLSIGIVRRCARLLHEAGAGMAAARIDAECDEVRAALDAGLVDPVALNSARAAAAQLAVRAGAALVTAGGGPSLRTDHQAQRLAREALFVLVAASRAEVKRLLLDDLSAPRPAT